MQLQQQHAPPVAAQRPFLQITTGTLIPGGGGAFVPVLNAEARVTMGLFFGCFWGVCEADAIAARYNVSRYLIVRGSGGFLSKVD